MKSISPNDFGRKSLESCQKIRIVDILAQIRERYKQELLYLKIDGVETVRTKCNYGGERLWFVCTNCKTKTTVLYYQIIQNKWQCRKCLRLPYKKQRYHGMLEEKIFS